MWVELRLRFKNAAIDPSDFFFFFKYFLKPRLKNAAIDITRVVFSINATTTVYLSRILYKCGLKHVYSCICLNTATGLCKLLKKKKKPLNYFLISNPISHLTSHSLPLTPKPSPSTHPSLPPILLTGT